MSETNYIGRTIYSRDGKIKGIVTGLAVCRMEGCRGPRLSVKWADGRRTFPCSKGCLVQEDGSIKII